MGNTLQLDFGASYKKIEVGKILYVAKDTPLKLACGKEISDFPIAYRTYGKLNKDKSNAIILMHGLTGDQYAAEKHPVTDKDGWFQGVIGKNKALDTSKYFIITPNVLGGCLGTYGPKTRGEATNFPIITIADMVNANRLLVKELGIEKLAAVMGGSLGGMQALQWANDYPSDTDKFIAISTAARLTPQNIAFNEVGRQAIIADENYHGGEYEKKKSFPRKGLGIARMMAHITYLSEDGLERKFGRRLQDKEAVTLSFDADYQVESYLRHQGASFIERFDPNSYMYLTRAMDYFNILPKLGDNEQGEFLFISFSSDWLFSPESTKEAAMHVSGSKAKVSYLEIESDKGHDAFLLNEPEFLSSLKGFLEK